MKKNAQVAERDLRGAKFSRLFLIFFSVSLIGWCVETVYCYFRFGKWIDRGFLTLPICPIYGLSVMTIYWLLGTYGEGGLLLKRCRRQPLRSIVYTVLAMLVPTVAELVTGAFFHRVFDVRLWDYRVQKYNLWGYICLKFSITFGILMALAMLLVFPLIKKGVSKLSERCVIPLSGALLAVTLLDCAVCFIKIIP